VFGQASFEIIENLDITIGARYTVDKKSISTATPLQNLQGGNSEDFTVFTPRFAAQYQWTPELMTYLSASKGYRAGGFNSDAVLGAAGFAPFDQEEAWSYEAGMKAEFIDRRLRLNVAAFQIDYTDLQLTTPELAPDGSSFTFLISNVGEVDIKGIELDAQLAISANTLVGGSYGYTDGRYKDVGDASITTDTKLAGAPENSYSLFAQYKLNLGQNGSITFRTDYGRNGDYETYASGLFSLTVESVGILGAQIKYETSDGRFAISLQGRNITNEKYFTSGFDVSHSGIPGLIGSRSVVPARPSEYYATLRYNFQ
jgi:iron complex outermembrane receptor protein